MANAFGEWDRLEFLLTAIKGRGIEGLPADDILEFGRLYRRASAELSFQRGHEMDPARLAYLNDLVGQCYPYIYTVPRRPWPSVRQFFTQEFPHAFRRHFLWVLLAFLITMVPAVIGFAISWHDRAIADQVLPAELMQGSDYVAARHHNPKDWLPLLERTPTATYILTHNIGICLLDFAGGMTGGLLTLFSLIYNGLMLGTTGAVVALDGRATSINFWAFVAPHGVFELTAIFISGGAGLLLAYALINPGELPRRIALREAGKEALKLMLGVAAMLTIAGLIEGFYSPMNIPERYKFLAAGSEAILLFGYLFFAGRRSQYEQRENTGPLLMTPIPPM
ncbi:MAG TPA: stage II sporulation protein M [Armatimonadota bacterium]|nr:stage II sporulation protein M [Armatimonadota bacterium]